MPYRHDIFELKCRKTQDKRRKMKRIETKKDGRWAILFVTINMVIKLLLSIPLFFYTEQLHFENKIGEWFDGTSVG
jgi:hypothetical protein